MLTVWTYKIKHSTLGSSFSVTFSVPPTELEYLNKLYDYFNAMNMSSFPITADRKTEPQTENPCDGCVCDDGKHLMYCMNCKGIAWKTEPPKNEPQMERSSE